MLSRVSTQFAVALCALAAAFVLAPSVAEAQIIGVGPGLFFDEGEMVGERRISVQRDDLGFDYGNESFMGGSLWLLFPTGDHARMGIAYNFYGSYDLRREDDNNNDDAVDELGWLMEFAYQLEWVLPMTDEFDFLIGGQLGLVLLAPGGQVEEDIKDYQDQGVDVIDAPRLGYVVGPAIGMKWNINEMFAVRSDFSTRWQQILLFTTDQTVGSTPFSVNQHTNIVRYNIGLGLEVAL